MAIQINDRVIVISNPQIRQDKFNDIPVRVRYGRVIEIISRINKGGKKIVNYIVSHPKTKYSRHYVAERHSSTIKKINIL